MALAFYVHVVFRIVSRLLRIPPAFLTCSPTCSHLCNAFNKTRMEMFLFIYYSLKLRVAAVRITLPTLSKSSVTLEIRFVWMWVCVGMCGYMREGGGRCNEREREKTAVAAMQ